MNIEKKANSFRKKLEGKQLNDMQIERCVSAYRMHLEGKTYAEIGEIFGVSRQRVEQIINGGGRHLKMLDQIRRPYLRDWMQSEHLSVFRFAKKLGLEKNQTFRKALKGDGEFKEGILKKISAVTGLTLEQIMEVESKEEQKDV